LGLTPIRSEIVDAPYADEFALVLECKVIQSHQIGESIQQFIGEIMDIKAESSILGENKLPDIAKLQPIVYDDVERNYYKTGDWLAKAFSVGSKE